MCTALVLSIISGCGPKPAPSFSTDLVVQFSSDIRGRLTPCGCFSGQFGGMSRMKTWIDTQPPAVTLRVDLGDAISGPADFERLRHRQAMRAFEVMGFDALNAGWREASLGLAGLREMTNSQVPYLSANLVDAATGEPVLSPTVTLSKAGLKIGVIGVMDDRGIGDRLGAGLRVLSPADTLRRRLPALRKSSDLVVVLAFVDEASVEALAREFYEADLILGGRVGGPAQDAGRAGATLYSWVANESRTLGRIVLHAATGGRPALRSHQMILLTDAIPEAPDIAALSDAYRREVREAKLAMDDPDRLAADRVPGVRRVAEYVGSESCATCHPAAAQAWEKSGHAQAFAALLQKRADADPACIACHTVGFGSPGGYRRALGDSRLVNVGCESCHGPGGLHVAARTGTAVNEFHFRPLGAGDCVKCHYGEFSRPFDWDDFWPRIAHGKEPVATSLSRP